MRQIELFQHGSMIAYDCPRCGWGNCIDTSLLVYDKTFGLEINEIPVPEFTTYRKQLHCEYCKLDSILDTQIIPDSHNNHVITTDYEGEILTPDEIQELRYAEARKMELDSRVNLFSAK